MIELKEHNESAVCKLVNNYKNGVRTQIYTSGVGTGKSFVFMGLIDRYFNTDKILYIMPKYAVEENIRGYKDFEQYKDRVDFLTFNSFTNIETAKKIINKYNLVVIDEAHHLGSDIYGKILLDCMNNTSAYYLGITATPIRDTDNIDVSDYFEKRVAGISLFDAIRLNLMKPIEYRLGLPEKDLKQIEYEYGNEVTAKIDYTKSKNVIRDVVKNYNRDKWICFFNSTKSLEENLPMIKDIFKNYDVYILLSSLKNLKEVMAGVKKSKKAVILSVNILLEGVHLENILGIILFRNTTSLSAFQQMLGRVCSLGNKISPVVLDCSQSSVKLMRKLLAENDYTGKSTNQKSNLANGKEIVRVGVGSHIQYDINELFRLVATSSERRAMDLIEGAKKAVIKYQGFGGKKYKSIEELKSNKLDYQKAKACSELYRTTIESFVEVLVGAS